MKYIECDRCGKRENYFTDSKILPTTLVIITKDDKYRADDCIRHAHLCESCRNAIGKLVTEIFFGINK